MPPPSLRRRCRHRSHELLVAIHQPPHSDHAAHRRSGACRASRRSGSCRFRRLPQVDFPTVSVSASLPGASPEIMASSVATPLEREFGRISSVTEMTSQSSLGPD